MKKNKSPARRTGSRKRTAGERCSVSHGSAIWQPADTAPKGPLILADFGWPWPVMATWCDRSNAWAAVSVQRESDGHGVAVDAWFDTEYESAEDLRRWQPWPSLPNNCGETRRQ